MLACAVLLAYWPSVHGGWLWDDAGHVTSPALQPLTGLWRIWFELGATQQYYPLLHSAFWLEHRLWGDGPTGYRLLNIALHVSSALFVAAIVDRLRLPGKWMATAIFALHPVQVESVAWIAEQKNTLSTLCYLASAFVYLGFDRSRSRRSYLGASVLFVCAALSKSATVTLPAALLVVIWWQRGSLDWKKDVAPLVPWLVFGVASGLFTAWVERQYIGASGADFTLSLLDRILLAGRVVWFYAATLAWPSSLSFNYPHWDIDATAWWQYLFPAGVAAIAAVCWSERHRHRGPLAVLLFFVGTLFPALGFVNVYPFRYAYVADHFQYVACLGPIVMVAVVVAGMAARFPRPSLAATALGVVLALVLGALTWRQSATYQDAETLWRATIAANPDSWLAHLNLGVELAERPGRLTEAIAEFETTLRLRPEDAGAHRNLGMALSKTPGQGAQAITEYEEAVRLDPRDAEAQLNLGRLLCDADPPRLPEGKAHVEEALRLKPGSAGAHYALGNVLARMGQPGAESEYREAIRLSPDYAEAHLNLGSLLATQARANEAIGEFQTALRIRPEYAEAHYDLANILMEMPGRLPDAIKHFHEALRIRPDYPEAHHNLALALLSTPNGRSEAIAQLEAALRLHPNLQPTRELLNELTTRRQ